MKLCFLTTLFLINGLAFAELRGSIWMGDEALVGDETLDLIREASALFKTSLQPAQIRRVKELKASLMIMFASLPKTKDGKLEIQVARYALHRLFEQQHSWSVEGLHSGGNTTKEDLFSQLTADSQGISINNLALLAMAVEDRIHQEVQAQVTSFELRRDVEMGRDLTLTKERQSSMNQNQFDALIEGYMTIYISGMRFYDLSSPQLRAQVNFMAANTTDWEATLEWVRGAKQDAVMKRKWDLTDASHIHFQAAASVVEDIVKGYGGWNNGECQRLKSTLLEVEDRKTGRLSLADFYSKGKSGTWEFNEKIDYLRDLGTLDESIPGKPRVIVANYVNSWVNCLTTSSHYSVCCSNECEELMGHLESNIKFPDAAPEEILQLVRSFRSDTLVLSTDISQLQQDRLSNIAVKHGGKVPLHGRLFAQWLHHVYPRSCPAPQAPGAPVPLTPDEWMKEKGHEDIKATDEEIMQCIGIHGNGAMLKGKPLDSEEHGASGEDTMHWSDEEEVLSIHHAVDMPMQKAALWRSNGIVMLAQVFVFAGICYGLKTFRKVFRPDKMSFQKHIV